jgi:hypothetical protein
MKYENMEKAAELAKKIESLELIFKNMDKTQVISFVGDDCFFENASLDGALKRSRIFPEIIQPMVEFAKKLIQEQIDGLKKELELL